MYEIGSRVKWYDDYAEGDIVRDAGYGLIVNFKEYYFRDHYVVYEVLKDGGRVEKYEHFQLEKLNACT